MWSPPALGAPFYHPGELQLMGEVKNVSSGRQENILRKKVLLLVTVWTGKAS